MNRRALVRRPGPRLAEGLLTHIERVPVDVDLAMAQWHGYVAALHDSELQDLNEQVYGEWRRIVAGVIRDGQVAGQFRAEDPVVVANALIGMIDGLALQVLVGSHSMTADRMRQVCHQMLRVLAVRP